MAKHSNRTDDTYVSTRIAAQMLDVSLRTIQLWVESGTLKAWKTAGGHRKVSRHSIERILIERQNSLNLEGKNENNVISGTKHFSVLLVEDDDGIKQLFSLFFTNWEYEVNLETADNGFEGLVKLSGKTFDLLITDINMPELNGYDMLQFLDQSEQFNHLDIIVITGLSREKLDEYGLLPKRVHLFFKPLNFDKLEPLVSRLASKQSARES